MGMIDSIVEEHFGHRGKSLKRVVEELDNKVYVAGVSTRMLRDMALHGTPGTSCTSIDPEEMAAAAEGLFAYIAQIGRLVDQLQKLTGIHVSD